MAQPLDAEGQRTPVTMDDDITQPEHITEAEREELARLRRPSSYRARRASRAYL
jgi:hypothetical protein